MTLYEKSKKILIIGLRHVLMGTDIDDRSFLACHGDMILPDLSPDEVTNILTRRRAEFAYAWSMPAFDVYRLSSASPCLIVFFKKADIPPVSYRGDGIGTVCDGERLTIGKRVAVYPDGRIRMVRDETRPVTARTGGKKENDTK